jgi:hypothetical protein
LILGLWISPDLQVLELDREEFETAVALAIVPPGLEGQAQITARRLKAEAAQGRFPVRSRLREAKLLPYTIGHKLR